MQQIIGLNLMPFQSVYGLIALLPLTITGFTGFRREWFLSGLIQKMKFRCSIEKEPIVFFSSSQVATALQQSGSDLWLNFQPLAVKQLLLEAKNKTIMVHFLERVTWPWDRVKPAALLTWNQLSSSCAAAAVQSFIISHAAAWMVAVPAVNMIGFIKTNWL